MRSRLKLEETRWDVQISLYYVDSACSLAYLAPNAPKLARRYILGLDFLSFSIFCTSQILRHCATEKSTVTETKVSILMSRSLLTWNRMPLSDSDVPTHDHGHSPPISLHASKCLVHVGQPGGAYKQLLCFTRCRFKSHVETLQVEVSGLVNKPNSARQCYHAWS